MPFYSIIVPAYNVGDYIDGCLSSVLEQDFDDYELIVVDDASTDGTAAILQRYAQKDGHVQVITKQVNEGRHLARLTGLENAHGRWVLFLDGDDQLHQGGLAALARRLAGTQADLVRFAVNVVPEGTVSAKQAKAIEQSYNTGEGTLTGSAIITASYGDEGGARVPWSVVNLAVASNVARTAARLMTRRRLDRLEDAYENFVLCALAQTEEFAMDIRVYDYHWGRGITGSSRLSLEEQQRHCRQIAAVGEAMTALRLERLTTDPSVKESLVRAGQWFILEAARHVSTELILRLNASQRMQAFLTFSRVWGSSIAVGQLNRLLHERFADLGSRAVGPDDEVFHLADIARTLCLGWYPCPLTGGDPDTAQVLGGDPTHMVVVCGRPQYLLPSDPAQEEHYLTQIMSGVVRENNPVADDGNGGKEAGRMRRIGIFCFFNKNGHADAYLKPLLDDVMRHVDDLVVVSNGSVSTQAREFFRQYTTTIITRPNKGLDVAAYRRGLMEVGWKKLETYDEVICFNDTIMGPVYPFSEMFETMDRKNVDFWGITAYAGETVNEETIPTHIQSYWHAYRRRLVSSQQFHDYWEKMPLYKDYAEVTRQHEMRFTQRFADLGFTWATYIDPQKYAGYTSYPMLYMPARLLEEDRCPVFKRRVFFLDYSVFQDQTAGQPALELFDYLRDHTTYDTDLIWDTLLRSYNLADIQRTMHLNYTLPKQALLPAARSDAAGKPSDVTRRVRSAFVFHIYFMDLLPETFRYLSSIPQGTDLYITSTPDKIDQIRQYAADNGFAHPIEYIPVKNRGRDVSALFVAARPAITSGKYEVVGFAHDKKSTQVTDSGHHGTESQGFAFKLLENTLGSEDYVRNILGLFADNPRLGQVSPIPPYHALYFAHTRPVDWGPDFEITQNFLRDRLHITVPLDPAKPTVSAIGSCYWFRVDALRPMFDLNLEYEDFLPEGEMGADGSISHAIERANGYIAQSRGYYPAWVQTDWYSRIETDSLLESTDTLLWALGSARSGETLLATAAGVKLMAQHSRSLTARVRRKVHLGLRKIASVTVRRMPQQVQDVAYTAAWAPINAYRHTRDAITHILSKKK